MPSGKDQTTHGRVRIIPQHGPNNEDAIGVTLAGTEHVLSLEDALGLANAIIFTVVDRAPHHMEDPMNEHLRQ